MGKRQGEQLQVDKTPLMDLPKRFLNQPKVNVKKPLPTTS
jgi:hypothetical protein